MKTIKVDVQEAVKYYVAATLDRLECDLDCIDQDYANELIDLSGVIRGLLSPDDGTKYTTFRRLMREGNAMFLLSPEQFDSLDEIENKEDGSYIELVERKETSLGKIYADHCNY
jgi:hypothetical protein